MALKYWDKRLKRTFFFNPQDISTMKTFLWHLERQSMYCRLTDTFCILHFPYRLKGLYCILLHGFLLLFIYVSSAAGEVGRNHRTWRNHFYYLITWKQYRCVWLKNEQISLLSNDEKWKRKKKQQTDKERKRNPAEFSIMNENKSKDKKGHTPEQ